MRNPSYTEAKSIQKHLFHPSLRLDLNPRCPAGLVLGDSGSSRSQHSTRAARPKIRNPFSAANTGEVISSLSFCSSRVTPRLILNIPTGSTVLSSAPAIRTLALWHSGTCKLLRVAMDSWRLQSVEITLQPFVVAVVEIEICDLP